MKVYGIVYRSCSTNGDAHSYVLADLFSDLDEAKSHVKGLISQKEKSKIIVSNNSVKCIVGDDSKKHILFRQDEEVSYEICEMNLR